MNDLISSKRIPQTKYATLCEKVVDEVTALSYCTGRTFTRGYRNPADEAYDAQSACDHLYKEGENRALEFYRKVALPALRHRMRFLEAGEGERWHISYEDLFLRVLAHQSREPVLVRAFLDGRDPVEACQERLEIEDPEVCYATLLWSSFSFDGLWFQRNYPGFYELLPQDLNTARKKVEERLPIIPLWVGRTMDDFTRQKAVRSLYGRVFRWNASVADACHFALMGSVRDILDVVLVSMLNNPEGAWVESDNEMDELSDRMIHIFGRAGKATRQSWVPVARILGEAGNPLSIPLGSTVVWS